MEALKLGGAQETLDDLVNFVGGFGEIMDGGPAMAKKPLEGLGGLSPLKSKPKPRPLVPAAIDTTAS